jgi:phosphate transport system substrate-binding protein
MRMTHRRVLSAFALAAVFAVVATACSSNDNSGGSTSGGGSFQGVAMTGAGSTLAQPMYQKWGQSFLGVEPNAKINYQAIGSGGGIEQFTAKTVDFGATDVPLQPDEISALNGAKYIEFPTVLAAVSIIYNVSGVQSGLQLDGTVISDIYMGKIKTWNDQAIASLNPGTTLPNTPINVVYRADESGTTAVFTGWLSVESSEWKSAVGEGKSVSWPTGKGANQSAGVAAAVKQTDGSISYVSYDFAVSAGLGVASIKAPDGSYVAPSPDSITAAGAGLSFPVTPTTNILDSNSSGAYPLSSTTYVLIYSDQTNQDIAQTLVDFWTWSLTKGQSQATSINYAPLPSSVAQGSLDQLKQINVNGTQVTASAGV